MKLIITLFACVLSIVFFPQNIFSQTTLAQESFETPAGDYGFTSNAAGACPDFFQRVTSDPSCFNLSIDGSADGNAWWASEDVQAAVGGDGLITLNNIVVTGFSNLQVTIAFADASDNSGFLRWETTDRIYIEYNIDFGSWNTFGLLRGAAPSSDIFTGTLLTIDSDNNPSTPTGTLTGATVGSSFSDFTFDIPVTGDNLQVRVRNDQNGGSEELGMDNIRVTGVMSSNMAPVLASIEGTTISYNEGDPAAQITNTITVSDADDANLASATVSIISGYDNTEDVLSFSASGGISGSFNSVTGILSLSGTSSVANYQTVLRSVTYQNTDAVDANPSTRTVQFRVNDGTDNSNFLTRNININTSLNTTPITLPFCESFETNGEGTRYGSNNFVNACTFAERDLNTNMGFGCHAETISGPNGTFVFFTENVFMNTDGSGNFTLTSQNISISGLNDMMIEVLLGVSRDDEDRWENTDQFRVEYNVDGGAYTIIGLFTGTNPDPILGGPLRQDTDNNSATLGPFGTQVTDTYQNFSFNFNVSGSVMTYRIVVLSTGTEELAFDNICVSGTAGQVGPTLANIEGSAITYTEGDPATQITNTITVTDPDDTNMESAAVSICSGFINGEDVLAFTSSGGITGTYTAATGTLAFSGSASIADYQTVLRSVTYQNTNLTNPDNGTREVCFIVNDGDVNSNQQSRLINIIDPLNAPTCLPFTESFESDGEGTTYGSNMFNDQPACEFFYRTATQPGCHADAITSIDGTFYWAGEDVRGGTNGNVPGIVTFQPLIATNYTGISVTFALAASNSDGTRWELDDFIRIQYQMDGGGFVTIGQFVGDAQFGGHLRQDADINGVADPAGAFLNSTLTDYTFNVPVTGNTLEVRVEVDQNGGSEEFVFDNIRVAGTLTGGTATVTCPIDPATIEGCSTADVQPTSSLAFSTSTVTITEAEFEAEGGDITPDGSANSITYQDMSTGAGVHPIIVTRTFTITSGCNSTETCTQTFTIQDTTPPTIPTCPPNVTVEGCDTDDLTADGTIAVPFNTALTIVTFTQFTSEGGVLNDNCTPQRSITHQDVASGSSPTEVTRTWTVEDFGFNTVQCVQTITIADTEPPVLICQDITVELPPSGSTTSNPFITGALVSQSDNCSTVGGVGQTGGNFNCNNVGTFPRTIFQDDPSGNEGSCTYNATVVDVTNPDALCQDITVQLDGSGQAVVVPSQIDNGSNDACGIASLNVNGFPTVSFACPNVGQPNMIQLNVTDNNGNSSNCISNVTVQDSNPIVTCPPDPGPIEGCTPADLQPTSSLAFSTTSVTITEAQFTSEGGAVSPTGSTSAISYQDSETGIGVHPKIITRIFTFASGCGATQTCMQTFTIQDTTPPTIPTCPPNVTVDACGPNDLPAGSVGLPFSAGLALITSNQFTNEGGVFSDNCTPHRMIQYQDVAGGSCPTSLTRTFTVTDFGFNTVQCQQEITIMDMTPPEITCPADPPVIEWPAGFNLSQVGPNTPQDPSIDPFGIPSQSSITTLFDGGNGQSGNMFDVTNVSSNPVTITSFDLNLDNGTTSNIDVYHTTNPGSFLGNESNGVAGGSNANWTLLGQVAGLASNGEGVPTPLAVGGLTLLPGETYGIFIIVTNGTNINYTDGAMTFNDGVLEINAGHGNGAPPFSTTFFNPRSWNGTVYYDTASQGFGEATATDNCGASTISYQDELDGPTQDCNALWTVVRTWTATDACGLTAICDQTFTFTDTTPPTIICPPDLTFEWPVGFSTSSVPADTPQDPSIDPQATGTPITDDNCAVASLNYQDLIFGPVPQDCPNLWTVQRTWTVTDVCGLTANCVQTFTFTDTTPPDITCPVPVPPQPTPLVEVEPNDVPSDPGVQTLTGESILLGTIDGAPVEDVWIIPDGTSGDITVAILNVFSPTTLVTINCHSDPARLTVPTSFSYLAGFPPLTVNLSAGSFYTITVLDFIPGFPYEVFVTGPALQGNPGGPIEWPAGFNLDPVPQDTPQDAIIDPAITGFATGTDNCGTPIVSYQDILVGPDPGNCPILWVVERTWTVTDFCGLTSTCLETFEFQDTTPPVAVCQSATVNLDANGNITLDPNEFDNGSFDNCAIASISVSPNMFDCTQTGVHTIVFTVTDACGLTATCETTVDIVNPAQMTLSAVVMDQTGPTFIDGSIDLTVAGGTPPLTYLWSNGSTNEDLSGLIGPIDYDVTVTDANGCFETATYFVDQGTIYPTRLCLKVFLQGSFNPSTTGPSDRLRTTLNNNGLLPDNHPYNVDPWNYMGTESFDLLNPIPTEMVDWVLVRVRDGSDPSIIVGEQACVLLSDGSIRTFNDFLPVFNLDYLLTHYIEILHRNHLPVVTPNPLQPDLPGGDVCHDYTTAMTQAFRQPLQNDDPMKQLNSLGGVFFAMHTGNVQSLDLLIDANDIQALFGEYNMSNQYQNSDTNMDTMTDANDINLLFGNYNNNAHTPY